jgi:hypothetical protein
VLITHGDRTVRGEGRGTALRIDSWLQASVRNSRKEVEEGIHDRSIDLRPVVRGVKYLA